MGKNVLCVEQSFPDPNQPSILVCSLPLRCILVSFSFLALFGSEGLLGRCGEGLLKLAAKLFNQKNSYL